MKQRLRIYGSTDRCPACGTFTTHHKKICSEKSPCTKHYGLTDFHFNRKCSTCSALWLELGKDGDIKKSVKEISQWHTDGNEYIPESEPDFTVKEQPKITKLPGFWKRLGDAIVKVIESWARSPKLVPVPEKEYKERVKNGE